MSVWYLHDCVNCDPPQKSVLHKTQRKIISKQHFYVTWGPDGRLNHVGVVHHSERERWGAEATSPTLPGYSAVKERQMEGKRSLLTSFCHSVFILLMQGQQKLPDGAPRNISIQYISVKAILTSCMIPYSLLATNSKHYGFY